jgi:multidrug/hemolysin transport system permease protein
MPMSQFSEGLRTVLSFLPSTYATSLVRKHSLDGAFAEMRSQGFPQDAVKGMSDTVDCNIEFFGNTVSEEAMYLYLSISVVVLIALYILLNVISAKKERAK